MKFKIYLLLTLIALVFSYCKEDPCAGITCENGGICIDGVCDCPEEFIGDNCETDICDIITCLNGGICVNGDCDCPEGFTGIYCETDMCDTITCLNGGTCVNGDCDCPEGFTGIYCETDMCDIITCLNGGVCSNGICNCPEGFVGIYCQTVCDSILIDPRDGQSYPTVQIGGMCWMAKNLNIGTMINSAHHDNLGLDLDEIIDICEGDIHPHNSSNNGIIEKYCYDNDSTHCETYGGFYQWDEMMAYSTTPGTQGICPPGWHVPTDDEWKQLEMALGMSQAAADSTKWRGTDQGDQLKNLWYCHGGINCGTSNFNALVGGYRSLSGRFFFRGHDSLFWSSSESSGCLAWARDLLSNFSQTYRYSYGKFGGRSCRCVKD